MLDQRSIHAEVLAREPTLALGLGQHFVEQRHHRIVRDQPLAVLAEYRRHPHRVIHRQSDEPAVQQVVLDLLHQLSLRTHAVEHLQQHRPQQFLWRDARPTAALVFGIHLREQHIQPLQCTVHLFADRPQRMRLRHEVVQLADREQALLEDIGSAHSI